MLKNQITPIILTNSETTIMDSHSNNYLERSSSIVSDLYYKTYKKKAIKMQKIIQDYTRLYKEKRIVIKPQKSFTR